MMHMTLILEDTTIVATYRKAGEDKPWIWDVTCQDNVTGQFRKAEWTNDQFGTVLALATGVAEDKTPGFDGEKLYAVAEPLLEGWPQEVRPIP